MANYVAGGIMPGTTLADNLSYITRRGFLAPMVVQIYKASPAWAAFFGNLELGSGGVSPFNQPVQYDSLVAGGYTDYSGVFPPAGNPQGIINAQWNYKMYVIPIPIFGMDTLLQDGHDIVNILGARINDVANVARQDLTSAFYTNTAASGSTSKMLGLDSAVSDTTLETTYAGLSRSTYTWWSAKYVANAAADPTRYNIIKYIASCTKNSGGEMPTFGIVGIGTWLKLLGDFQGYERYNITPEKGFDLARSGFTAIDLAGVPIYADVNCAEGQLYLLNTRYMTLYSHPQAKMTFSGFYSLIPNNQVGYVGVNLFAHELVCVKPKAQAQIRGFNYESI